VVDDQSDDFILTDKVSADLEKFRFGGPLIDGGRKAWVFLLGAFAVDGVMWGIIALLLSSC
jgi:hypothetical protein